jgi:two-component sensor histidine kinase
MVLTEVLQNAVEHGYDADPAADSGAAAPGEPAGGTITVEVGRRAGRLEVAVVDDGRGLPEGFSLDGSTNLGLSIVRTLVESELGGRLTLGPAEGGGTRAGIDLPLD